MKESGFMIFRFFYAAINRQLKWDQYPRPEICNSSLTIHVYSYFQFPRVFIFAPIITWI